MTNINSIPTIEFKDLWQNTAEGYVLVQQMAGGAAFHNWSIPSHRHQNMYQLFLITQGQGSVELDGKPLRFEAPWLLWIPANTVHSLELNSGIDGLLLTISADYLLAMLSDKRRPVSAREHFDIVHSLRVEESLLIRLHLVEYLNVLSTELNPSTWEGKVALESLIKLILISVMRLRAEGTAAIHKIDSGGDIFTRFRHLVEKHYRDHIAIKEYARQLNISEQHLHSICKASAGKSPQTILHDRLILEATREMLYTTQTIAEVAFALGFEDPAYFSRFFKKRVGSSPLAYRRNTHSQRT